MKYIFQDWVNGNFEVRWLRRINRETDNFWISDVQYEYDWRKKGTKCVRWKNRSKKYKKMADGGIGRRITNRDNTDGILTLNFVNPSKLECKYSYEEIFQTDLRLIQDERNMPLYSLKRKEELYLKKNIPMLFEKYFLESFLSDANFYPELESYLKDLFQVDVVFYIAEMCFDYHNNMGLIGKSVTYFQITHFGDDKDKISEKEHRLNETIGFWKFGNKLIFSIQDGIGSW